MMETRKRGNERTQQAQPGSLLGERGSALAAVLVLVVLLTVAGAAMVNSTLTEISVAYNAGDATAAQYAAEAGLSRAIYQLSQDAGWTGTTTSCPPDGWCNIASSAEDGQYKVTITSSGLVRSITSTGTRGGGRRVLKAALKAVSQSAISTVLANTTATIGSPSAGLTVKNDFPSSAASAVHANNKLSAPTSISVNTAGASIIGGLTANGVITGLGCASWAWTCNTSASARAIPELDVDSAATSSLKYRAQHTFDADGKYLYFKGGDTGRCNSGGSWTFTSTQQCWDNYVNSKSGTLGSGISNPVFYIEFAAGESTTYTTGGGGGSVTTSAPITIRGDPTTGYTTTGSTSGSGTLTINKPTGVVDGDVLIAAIGIRGTITSAPAGWTSLGSRCNPTPCGGSNLSLTVYWKRAASEGANYGWGVSGKAAGSIVAYYNVVATGNPYDLENGQTTPSSTTHSTPSITTTVGYTMLVASYAVAVTANVSPPMPPNGMVERSQEWSSGTGGATSHVTIDGSDIMQDGIGATGSKTATSSAGAVGVTHILALKPATATVATSSGSSTPTFRAASSANVAAASLTLAKPAGVVDGDVMIANIRVYPSGGSSGPVVAPAGWNLVRAMTSYNAFKQAVYWKAAAGEGASYVFTASNAFEMAGGIMAYYGVDTVNPIDAENGQAISPPKTASEGRVLSTPALITTVNNDMLVASFALSTSAGSSVTPPAGMTERYETATGSPAATAEGADLLVATAGLAGAKTATTTFQAYGIAHLLALRPAGAGGAATVNCGGATYTETLCIRATPASPYPNSVLSQVTGAIVTFRRPISVRGSASATISGSTSLTISKPAGVVDNDVMIAQIAVASTTATSTPPAGWTLVRRLINSVNGALTTEIFRKVASGEGPSYIWSYTGSQSITGGIIAYSGVDTTTPIDVENGQTTSGPFPSTPTVTTTAANEMLVAMFAISASTSFTAPTGMTERYDPANAFGAPSIQGADQIQSAAGATGSKTATTSSGTAAATGELLALRPSSTTVVGDIVFENMASASANYTHTYQGSDPALLAAGKISMISSSASAGRATTSITGIVYTFAGSDNPDGIGNLQGVGNLGFDLQHGANSIALTLSGLLLSNGSISLQDTGGTGTATIQYNRTVVENLPAAFTSPTAGFILVPLSWSSGD